MYCPVITMYGSKSGNRDSALKARPRVFLRYHFIFAKRRENVFSLIHFLLRLIEAHDEEDPVFSSPRHYLVWAQGKTPMTSKMMTPTLVDVETGTLTMSGGLPWYLRALELSRPLHFGDYGGLPLKIIWGLFDIALIAVLVSGVYLWLSKRKTPMECELDTLIESEMLREVKAI